MYSEIITKEGVPIEVHLFTSRSKAHQHLHDIEEDLEEGDEAYIFEVSEGEPANEEDPCLPECPVDCEECGEGCDENCDCKCHEDEEDED